MFGSSACHSASDEGTGACGASPFTGADGIVGVAGAAVLAGVAGLAGSFGSIGFSGFAGVPGVPGFIPGVAEPLGLNTCRRFPVSGSTFVPTNSYPGTSPAGLLPSANGFNGLPFISTHTVTGFLVAGLKM